jgi:hypothetical protein
MQTNHTPKRHKHVWSDDERGKIFFMQKDGISLGSDAGSAGEGN